MAPRFIVVIQLPTKFVYVPIDGIEEMLFDSEEEMLERVREVYPGWHIVRSAAEINRIKRYPPPEQ